jgi:hypothetical protein
VWQSPALRLTLATLSLLGTISILILPAPWVARLFVVGLFGLSLVQPRAALLALTVVVFLGFHRQPALDFRSLRLTDAWPSSTAIFPFFAGWLLRPRSDRRGPRVPRSVAWVTTLAVAACAVAGILKPEWIRQGGAMSAALTLPIGLGLMAATVTLFRWYPRLARELPVAMVSSALVGATASVLLVRELDSRHLAATFCVAIGMAASKTARARGERLLWSAAAAANGVALSLALLTGGGLPDFRDLTSAGSDRYAGAATGLLALSSVAIACLLLLRCGSALARAPRDFRLLGCGLGAAVTTATWLVEPWRALSEQAFPSWILVGLVAGLGGSSLIETRTLPPTPAGTAAGLRV